MLRCSSKSLVNKAYALVLEAAAGRRIDRESTRPRQPRHPFQLNRMRRLSWGAGYDPVDGLPGESRRLVYAEELAGESQGLNLLATHRLDGRLSVAFFGDPDRMEIDLLGNAAAVYLDSFDFGR